MNPSRLFILRPVATTLLMVAILLAGIVAYRVLPLSALPEVDYPTIQVVTLYPGASPDVMTSSITAPLERQFGQMPGLNQMSSTSSGGASVITLQFSLDALARRRRAGGAGGDQRVGQLPADRPAEPADLQQGQSGRHADPDARADVEDAAAAEARGPRRHADRAEDLAAPRRRPRQHQRRPAPGRAHPGQSEGARRLRPLARRRAHRDRQRQHQPGEGQLRRPDARVDDRRQRPAQVGRRVPAADHRLQERRAGPPLRRRRRRRRRREHAPRRLGEHDAGDHPQRPAPARHQRDRGRRPHQEAAAAAAGVAAAGGRRRRCSPTARSRSARRCATCSSSCCSPSRWS